MFFIQFLVASLAFAESPKGSDKNCSTLSPSPGATASALIDFFFLRKKPH